MAFVTSHAGKYKTSDTIWMSVTYSGAQHHSCFFYIAFSSFDGFTGLLFDETISSMVRQFSCLKGVKTKFTWQKIFIFVNRSLCEDWIDCELINLSIFTSYTPLLRIYFQILFLLTLFPGYDNALATKFSDLYFCSIRLGGLICFLLQ